jgi:hypothetical protein
VPTYFPLVPEASHPSITQYACSGRLTTDVCWEGFHLITFTSLMSHSTLMVKAVVYLS